MARRAAKLGLGVLAATVIAAGAFAGWAKWAPRHAPVGQAALRTLGGGELDVARAAFNAAPDETRVLALLSPT